ncbi:hypothetical protein Esti_003700 [Eimeria stiedai]
MWALLGYTDASAEETAGDESASSSSEAEETAAPQPPPSPGGGGMWAWLGYGDTAAEGPAAPTEPQQVATSASSPAQEELKETKASKKKGAAEEETAKAEKGLEKKKAKAAGGPSAAETRPAAGETAASPQPKKSKKKASGGAGGSTRGAEDGSSVGPRGNGRASSPSGSAHTLTKVSPEEVEATRRRLEELESEKETKRRQREASREARRRAREARMGALLEQVNKAQRELDEALAHANEVKKQQQLAKEKRKKDAAIAKARAADEALAARFEAQEEARQRRAQEREERLRQRRELQQSLQRLLEEKERDLEETARSLRQAVLDQQLQAAELLKLKQEALAAAAAPPQSPPPLTPSAPTPPPHLPPKETLVPSPRKKTVEPSPPLPQPLDAAPPAPVAAPAAPAVAVTPAAPAAPAVAGTPAAPAAPAAHAALVVPRLAEKARAPQPPPQSILPSKCLSVSPACPLSVSCWPRMQLLLFLAKADRELVEEQGLGPMHFIFRGAPFAANGAIKDLRRQTWSLQQKAEVLEQQLRANAEQHHKAMKQLVEGHHWAVAHSSQKAIRLGAGLAKMTGVVTAWRSRQQAQFLLSLLALLSSTRLKTEVVRRLHAEQQAKQQGPKEQQVRGPERAARLCFFVLNALHKRRLAFGLLKLAQSAGSRTEHEDLVLPGLLENLVDERTRLAVAAMAEAKQDTLKLQRLVATETEKLEAERRYLGRWRRQLLLLTEAAEGEAFKTLERV